MGGSLTRYLDIFFKATLNVFKWQDADKFFMVDGFKTCPGRGK